MPILGLRRLLLLMVPDLKLSNLRLIKIMSKFRISSEKMAEQKKDDYYLIVGRFVQKLTMKLLFVIYVFLIPSENLVIICNHEVILFGWITTENCLWPRWEIKVCWTVYDQELLEIYSQPCFLLIFWSVKSVQDQSRLTWGSGSRQIST